MAVLKKVGDALFIECYNQWQRVDKISGTQATGYNCYNIF